MSLAKDSVRSLIEEYLKEKYRKSAAYVNKNYSLSPSILGDKCQRKKYFSYFKIPQAIKEVKNILTLESGNNVHYMIQSLLGDTGKAIDYLDPDTGQVPFKFGRYDIEFPISIPQLLIKKGKIDRVMLIDGELWLIEIKSIGDFKFSQLKEPAFDHIIQGTVYLFGFEMNLQEGAYDHIPQMDKTLKIKGLKFIYVNRDNGQMKEYLLEKNQDLFIEICKDINDLAEYIKVKELPPAPKGGLCQYCPYPDLCSKNKNPPGESK